LKFNRAGNCVYSGFCAPIRISRNIQLRIQIAALAYLLRLAENAPLIFLSTMAQIAGVVWV